MPNADQKNASQIGSLYASTATGKAKRISPIGVMPIKNAANSGGKEEKNEMIDSAIRIYFIL